ncbi:MAG: hypothetical protein R3304_08465, partial [Longimicrobiales bacterium]|nr:hypothetical protein [Longimicrobiales bacterium]
MRITTHAAKACRLLVLLVLGLYVPACSEDVVGVQLTGIWVADSHEYESASGQVVDIVARDGATTTLAANLTIDGWRVSVTLDDGQGNVENLFGTVEEGSFVFPDAVWTFTRNDDRMRITDESATFDFGDGPEPASLEILLT